MLSVCVPCANIRPGAGETRKLASSETIDQVHEQEEAAKGIAIPTAYDVGAQRNSWVSQGITNWMGDDGFLKSLYCEYRRFNVYGDIQFIKGKITKKYELNGEHLVDYGCLGGKSARRSHRPRQSHRHPPL